MIELLGKKYKLVLVDTNVLSEICKTKGFLLTYLKLFPVNKYLLSYSAFTLFEISRNDEVFEKYKNLFFIYPSVVLNSNEPLIFEEKENYYTKKAINPMSFAPSAIIKEGKKFSKESLHDLFKFDKVNQQFEMWNESINPILEGMLEMRQNYLPKEDGSYTKKMAFEFVKKTVEQQIYVRFPEFTKIEIEANNGIDYNKFLSLKMMALSAFYKFYSGNKKPNRSDVMDIIISSTVPYVDTFISEGNMIDIMSKIKNMDPFIENVELTSIKLIKKKIKEST